MNNPKERKGELHPRNPHRDGYDFDSLIEAYPALEKFVALNKFGTRSINFFDSTAVRTLNAALLARYYNIVWWEIPSSALTPPVPGRADYIHHVADLIGRRAARCLDIGVGANCIYPIIGHAEYGWQFVGSDIAKGSLESAQKIIDNNPSLSGAIELRHQPNPKNIFEGIIRPDEKFDVVICNPPFHTSKQSAEAGTRRKLRGLGAKSKGKVELNFAGQSNELWCDGGERRFITQMITESFAFRSQCGWFTSLVSNEDNLAPLKAALRGAREVKTIEMSQGNKRSRILAWHY